MSHRAVFMRLEVHSSYYALWPLWICYRGPICCISLHEIGKTICHEAIWATNPSNLSPFLIICAGNSPSPAPDAVIEKEQALACTKCDVLLFYLIFVFIRYIFNSVDIPPTSHLRVPRAGSRTRCQKIILEIIWQYNSVATFKVLDLFRRSWPNRNVG